jgi:hypothetical protein
LLLPAWSGVQVYVGHYSETIDYFAKIQAERTIFNPQTGSASVSDFLRSNGITMLYDGPDEAKTGFDPGSEPFLLLIYRGGDVSIYRVVGP